MNNEIGSEKPFNHLYGLINLLAVFVLVWLLWYLFMNPNTVMKLYTPMYGFSLVVAMVAAIVLMTGVADYYPFAKPSLENSPVGRGILLTLVAFALMLFLVYVIFWNGIGRYGIAYFSPEKIVASGGIGAEPYSARENASTAIIYYSAAFLWIALFWNVGFGRWPWHDTHRSTMVWSRFFVILFLVTIVYSVLFHPHVCQLFYPAQSKAGVDPWWSELCGTGSAFFSLGLVLCTLFWIVASDLLWEGYPWKLMEKDGEGTFLKGIVTFAATLAMGSVLLWILLKIMVAVWDEPFMGGQYTDGPDFRFIHAGEISGFFILAAFILKYYFDNFPKVSGPWPRAKNLPQLSGIWPRAVIRTLIAIAGGMLFYGFYYSPLSTFFLAKVPGFAQPGDTPLVWALLFLSVVMIQSYFFNGWPLKRQES